MTQDVADKRIELGRATRRRLFSLLALAVCLAIAPWPFSTTPHLYEKSQMLVSGKLSAPLDIFDLFFHSSGFFLFIYERFRSSDSE